jgi:hypothetical protein
MPSALSTSKPHFLRRHPHLYEINTWPWLEQLSSRLGREIKLGDVPDSEWDSLARLGFDIVWLMGVWQRSPESRRAALADPKITGSYEQALPGWTPNDVIGSPYSVKQYVPDPRIGTWEHLDRAREKLQARGIALFLDFVGNHTALDHPWTREHPEFYVLGTAKDFAADPGSFFRVETPKGVFYIAFGKDPYFPAWTDVAQLDHFHLPMRAAQISDLCTIAGHCDGVRCDMAMLQLNDIFARTWSHRMGDAKRPEREFWEEAHAAVPGLILLAEAYWGTEPRLIDLGFSFVYDKELYDAVRDSNVDQIRAQLLVGLNQQSQLARFLENHDEPPCVDVFGKQRLPSVATLMGTLPGMRFYYQDQLQGCEPHLPISLRTQANRPPDVFCSELFTNILGETREEIFHDGEWRVLQTSAVGDATFGNLIAYQWRSPKAWKVIAVNLRGTPSQGRVQLGESIASGSDYIFHDELHDVRYPRNGAELRERGLFVRLEGFQAHLFDVSKV